MGERKQIGPRVDEDVYARFKEYTRDKKGRVRGELGRLLERAMIEYMDNDRANRIETKVDRVLDRLDSLDGTHAHKATPTEEKAETIATELAGLDQIVIPEGSVEDTIGGVAGHDPRTLEKYKDLLNRKGLAYKHPTGNVWTVERDRWIKWASDYLDNDPVAEMYDITRAYPITPDELAQAKTEVPQ